MTTGAAIDYVAAFNLAWVTAGADFTRFTPSRANSVVSPFVGAMVGVLWFAFIGLISTISIAITSGAYNANNSDPSTIAAKLGLGVIALLVIVLTSMTANAVNLLGAGSALSNIFPKLNLKLALWIVVILATVVTLIPMFVGSFRHLRKLSGLRGDGPRTHDCHHLYRLLLEGKAPLPGRRIWPG